MSDNDDSITPLNSITTSNVDDNDILYIMNTIPTYTSNSKLGYHD